MTANCPAAAELSRFVADVYEAEKPGSRNFFSKVWMQLKLANETSHVIRRIRKTEQLA